MEKSMLTELKNSVVGKASRFASLWAGIIDGLSPALVAVVCLAPFFLSSLGSFSINFTIQLSVGMALSIMFLFGVFLGKISSRNMFFHGVKMLFVGLTITFIFLMLKIIQQTPTFSLSVASLKNEKVDINRTVIRKFRRLL